MAEKKRGRRKDDKMDVGNFDSTILSIFKKLVWELRRIEVNAFSYIGILVKVSRFEE